MNAHFVLVHGFCHGGWCWYKIKCQLENLGYKVSCPDLKASGIDQTDPNTVFSFEEYNQPLIDLLSTFPDDEKVILVGHSVGGFNVTQATDRFGKKLILVAIYLAASMYRPGVTPQEDINYGAPDFSKYGGASNIFDVNFGLGPEKRATSILMRKEFQRQIYYNMSPQEDVALASMLLRPAPNYAVPSLRFTNDGDEGVEKVPCIYIRTMRDQMMRAEKQENMINKCQPWKAYKIESDHSAFFSAPDALVSILVEAAASVGYDAPNP
ncbi:hypothetical protein Leryth_018056 [Lithospermum erythrorhizon]|nr:hypothetical protein Leryth_018056 [Lithospermum erythrorhizon]